MDEKLHWMLFWSAIGSVLSSTAFIMAIARAYQYSFGKHPGWLVACLGFIVAMSGVKKFLVWKYLSSERTHHISTYSSVITYNINKLTGQRKLIFFYLVEISFLLLTTSVFFVLDIRNGFYQLLKFTAPVITLTYALGFYFIMSFTRQIKEFSRMKKQVDHLNLKQVSQN